MSSECVPDDCTAIALAGGLGQRMGGPKARLSLAGTPLLHRVLAVTQQAATQTIVVTAPDLALDLPDTPRLSVVTDLQRLMGPLMALYTGLSASTTECNVVVGCDLPFLNAPLLRHLINLADGYDAVVPVFDGRPQYLHAVYKRACIPAIERLLGGGTLKLGLLAGQVDTRYVQRDEWAAYDPDGRSFLNLNTPEDLERAEALATYAIVGA